MPPCIPMSRTNPGTWWFVVGMVSLFVLLQRVSLLAALGILSSGIDVCVCVLPSSLQGDHLAKSSYGEILSTFGFVTFAQQSADEDGSRRAGAAMMVQINLQGIFLRQRGLPIGRGQVGGG